MSAKCMLPMSSCNKHSTRAAHCQTCPDNKRKQRYVESCALAIRVHAGGSFQPSTADGSLKSCHQFLFSMVKWQEMCYKKHVSRIFEMYLINTKRLWRSYFVCSCWRHTCFHQIFPLQNVSLFLISSIVFCTWIYVSRQKES